jgi:hypothetical protein
VPGFIDLAPDGKLKIYECYAWDGPSGPAFDTKAFMRPSLVHDALYQLMRESELDQEYREPADVLLREMCIEDGMCRLWAWIVYWAVHCFAGFAAKPSHYEPELLCAPKDGRAGDPSRA